MELIELTAKPRETTGKGAARELRRNNAIPAIVYGPKTDPMMLSLETVGFDKIIKKFPVAQFPGNIVDTSPS